TLPAPPPAETVAATSTELCRVTVVVAPAAARVVPSEATTPGRPDRRPEASRSRVIPPHRRPVTRPLAALALDPAWEPAPASRRCRPAGIPTARAAATRQGRVRSAGSARAAPPEVVVRAPEGGSDRGVPAVAGSARAVTPTPRPLVAVPAVPCKAGPARRKLRVARRPRPVPAVAPVAEPAVEEHP